jgi:glycosyltransferase involved in cell wall biosynthesis
MPSSGPLVTVVTPSLNQKELLAQCLGSVGSQEYERVQHIVVDGGSSDGTLELLGRWESPPDRTFLSEPDQGMYDALNKGMRMAEGDLLAYLNCDDLYFPHSLRALVEVQTAGRWDVVFGDMARCYVDGRIVLKFQPSHDRGFYGYYYQMAQPATLWTRSLFTRLGGFDPRYRLAGDTDFFLRAANAGARFGRIDEVVCVERHAPGCLSAAFRQKHREEVALAVSRHGVWRGPWERSVLGPLRVARALARQSALAVAFARSYRSPSPRRWCRFIGSGYLSQLSSLRLLANIVPAPLLREKRSVGRLDWASPPSPAARS